MAPGTGCCGLSVAPGERSGGGSVGRSAPGRAGCLAVRGARRAWAVPGCGVCRSWPSVPWTEAVTVHWMHMQLLWLPSASKGARLLCSHALQVLAAARPTLAFAAPQPPVLQLETTPFCATPAGAGSGAPHADGGGGQGQLGCCTGAGRAGGHADQVSGTTLVCVGCASCFGRLGAWGCRGSWRDIADVLSGAGCCPPAAAPDPTPELAL